MPKAAKLSIRLSIAEIFNSSAIFPGSESWAYLQKYTSFGKQVYAEKQAIYKELDCVFALYHACLMQSPKEGLLFFSPESCILRRENQEYSAN